MYVALHNGGSCPVAGVGDGHRDDDVASGGDLATRLGDVAQLEGGVA